MKSKKNIILIIVSVVVLLALSLGIYLVLRDKNKLTAQEKKWIDSNKDILIDFRIVNDVSTFGISGEGVFFDFLNDFSKKNELTINPITYLYGTYTSDLTFNIGNAYAPDDLVFYKDHYVVIGKNEKVMSSIHDLSSYKIGILNADLTYISYYLKDVKATYTVLESKDGLESAFKENDYVIAPLNLYLKDTLSKNYHIVYHLSDIHQYYYLSLGNNKTLASIIQKFYNNWIEKDFEKSYYKNLFATFTTALNISAADLYELTSKTYTYGVLENAPYEALRRGKLIGINAEILNRFTKMTNTDFDFTKYKNTTQLSKAISKNKVELYFNKTKIENNLKKYNTLLAINYDVVVKNNMVISINSTNSLSGKNVYIEKDTELSTYFKSLNVATVKEYTNQKDIKKLINNGEIVILDSNVYNTLINTTIKDASSRYTSSIDQSISFKSNASDVFNKLFSSYLKTIDNNEMIVLGMHEYNRFANTSNILQTILDNIIYILVGIALIAFVTYRIKKRTKIVKRIKKEDKIKYIDMLTSLKNRNYLHENIEKWDQNTIYPQGIIMIDLNNIKYLNDTYGHEEGDKQIRACANILIKTQVDNSEIIRTDGNEFLVYLVGYNEKQIGSYLRKLSKEFSKLPYNYGAAIGYTMINDDLKLMEDAINEATIDMRAHKDKEEK